MRNDSIFGVEPAGVMGLAAEDVGMLEVRRFSIWRTLGLGYLVFGGLVLTACSQGGCEL
jgi:hypothetical protein